MFALRITALAFVVIGAPLAAQDLPAAINPTDVGRTMVLVGQNEGYVDRGNARAARSGGLSKSSRAYCASVPTYRAKYGASDPRVVRLAGACRKAGYRY